MRSSILVLGAIVAGYAKRETTMFFPEIGGEAVPMVAKVLEKGDDATTYVVGCPANLKTADCSGYDVPIIATQGRYTAHYNRRFIGVEGKQGPEYE